MKRGVDRRKAGSKKVFHTGFQPFKGRGNIVKRSEVDNFYRWANTIALILLIYTLLLLISTSKIMERAGKIEQDISVYGGYLTGDASQSGTVSISIRTLAPESNATISPPGGRGFAQDYIDLKFEPDLFELGMLHNEKVIKTLVIRNLGEITLELSAESNIPGHVSIGPKSISISPGSSRAFEVEFDAKTLGVTIGYITISGEGLVGYVPVIMKVSSKAIMGDVMLDIPEQFRQVNAGDDVVVNVNLLGFEQGIVDLVYILKDIENKEIFRSTQKMTIKGDLEFDKTLALPEGLKDGLYVLAVEVRYNGLSLVESKTITIGKAKEPVVEKPGLIKDFFMSKSAFELLILLIIGLIIISFIMYSREVTKLRRLSKEAQNVTSIKKKN